jgi:amphi-Trp domain-containing protein
MNEDDVPGGAESPTDDDREPAERSPIRAGRNFEDEFRLDADEAGRFLIDLGERLRSGEELTLETEEWELPFEYGTRVDLEIDYEGVEDPELEIELELRGKTEDAPAVE